MQQEWSNLVKQYRLRFGLTQQDMALLFGVSQKTVSRWESGENRPGLAQQVLFKDLFREPSSIAYEALAATVKNCPAPRALCFHDNLNLQALSQLRIAKRPSIVNWIGCDLLPIVCGVQAEMLDDYPLQHSIRMGEIACINTVSRSNLLTPEYPIIGTHRTTISFFRIDGRLLRDSISVPAPEGSELGYWPVPLDEIVTG